MSQTPSGREQKKSSLITTKKKSKKEEGPIICCFQETHFKFKDTDRLEVNENIQKQNQKQRNIEHSNSNKK